MPRRFLKSVGALTIARAALIGSQILVLPVVARYLSLEDFALVALAMTVPIFATMLSDAGMGRSLVRAGAYDADEWSTVFWLMAVVGVVLMGLVLALAPVAAWFFGQPRLVAMVGALAVVPFLQALSAAPNAELERRQRFSAIARVQIVATVAGFACAVTLAVAGFGAWALIVQQIVLPLVRLAGLGWMTLFRPRLRFVPGLLRGHVAFGRDTLAVSGVYLVIGQAPIVTIGRVLGEAPLALYAMSERFARLPQFGFAGPFAQVVYVHMARAKHDPVALARLHLAATRILAVLVMPPLALLAASGDATFTVLLSARWADVAPIFALAATGVALDAATSVAGGLLMATGATALRVRMAIEALALWLVLLAIAAPFGVAAIAAARSIWVVAFLPRHFRLIRRCAPVDARQWLCALGLPAALSGGFWIAHLALVAHFAPPPLAEMALAAGGAMAAACLAVALSWSALRRDVACFRA